MTTSGIGIYFDGTSAARHQVTVELADTALRIRAADGKLIDEWGYDQIEPLSAPEGVLRIGRAGSPVLARLEVRDAALATAIDERSLPVDRSGRTERRERRRVIVWSIAATLSLIAVAVLGVPQIANRLAPLVPYPVERRLGDAIEVQVRRSLDTRHDGAAFECGNAEGEKAGQAAFTKLMAQLEATAALPFKLNASVVRRSEANAFALPGGRVYVFQGLIDKAISPEEVAGVIAHEAGHVAHRDGMRSVLEGAGLSFLFGMLLGDFVGGGAVVFAGKAILETRYSRQVESAADAYGVALMLQLGADARALATILQRISGNNHPGSRLLLDHPETQERVAAINALAGDAKPSRTLLEPAEWNALKTICSGSKT
jgi:Zn-dependent protease with chaperone function